MNAHSALSVIFFYLFLPKRKRNPEGINWSLRSSEEEMGGVVTVVYFLIFKKYCSALEMVLFSKTTTKGGGSINGKICLLFESMTGLIKV